MESEQQLLNQILESIKQIVEKSNGYTVDFGVRNENYKPDFLRKKKNKIIAINIRLEKEL
jgi:hypothetical protein